ncbi:MAG TPA: hypothetical protein DCK87_01370 [Desulfotomaculum sp.]|nr:hypothetical protein [Desulfotomaculum sp.]
MRTIEVREGIPSINELLKLARDENIILKLPDGQEFLLAEIDDFEREIELTRENEELMKFLDERSKNPRTFTLNEVREQLGLK